LIEVVLTLVNRPLGLTEYFFGRKDGHAMATPHEGGSVPMPTNRISNTTGKRLLTTAFMLALAAGVAGC
jgi:hypothetical protein